MKCREEALNCTKHLLLNHTFSKTPNMELDGQLLESYIVRKKHCAEEQSRHSPMQICRLVEMKLRSKEPLNAQISGMEYIQMGPSN